MPEELGKEPFETWARLAVLDLISSSQMESHDVDRSTVSQSPRNITRITEDIWRERISCDYSAATSQLDDNITPFDSIPPSPIV